MEDQQSFFNFLRMPPEMFDELLNRVGPRNRKMDTHYRKALEPGMKLAISFRHLASGDKYPTLQYDQSCPQHNLYDNSRSMSSMGNHSFSLALILGRHLRLRLRNFSRTTFRPRRTPPSSPLVFLPPRPLLFSGIFAKYFNTNKRVVYTCMKNSYNVLRAR